MAIQHPYFFDTEFDEAPGKLDLISIGITDLNGRDFYAISRGFDPDNCNPWVKTNVLPRIDMSKRQWRADIRGGLLKYIEAGDGKPVFYGYFADYDWILFCWLFGAMVDLPKGFPMYCRDLKQSMDERGIRKSTQGFPKKPKDAHHALADAKWHRSIYQFIRKHDEAHCGNVSVLL